MTKDNSISQGIRRIRAYQRGLLKWWKSHKRDFPWRHHFDAYHALVAEMMLRRTRAEQVVPVYEKFINTYPSLPMAAKADPKVLREILYPLGLTWRVENIVTVLKEAYTRYGDTLPCNIDELRTLPGVGEYVSAAIACFVDNQCVPLIDTNVVRVLGRIFGLDIKGEARRRKEMRMTANLVIYQQSPREYHYALLDFAALVCTAFKPDCISCPAGIRQVCFYRSAPGDISRIID